MSSWISSAAACHSRGELDVLADLRQPCAAVGGHPAHELRRREVLRLAAHLPDAAVGLAPVLQRRLDLLDEDRPDPLGQVVARLGVQVERVEHRAPHVVLVLVVGAVADPHGARALVAGEVVERLLDQLGLAADPVHDLEPALLGLGHVGDEVEEVVGLPVEAERVEAPEHERGVADPGVAVVPVALPAGRLGKRRGGGGHHRPGRRVGEALQRERAALEVGPPRVVGELAVVEPVLPVVGRPDQPLVRLVVGLGAGCSDHDSAANACRPPSSACGRWRAGPRSRRSCRWSGAASRPAPWPVAIASW